VCEIVSEYVLRVHQRNGNVVDLPYYGQQGRDHVRAAARAELRPRDKYEGADLVEIMRPASGQLCCVDEVRS
jgi:hypothetical protein